MSIKKRAQRLVAGRSKNLPQLKMSLAQNKSVVVHHNHAREFILKFTDYFL